MFKARIKISNKDFRRRTLSDVPELVRALQSVAGSEDEADEAYLMIGTLERATSAA